MCRGGLCHDPEVRHTQVFNQLFETKYIFMEGCTAIRHAPNSLSPLTRLLSAAIAASARGQRLSARFAALRRAARIVLRKERRRLRAASSCSACCAARRGCRSSPTRRSARRRSRSKILRRTTTSPPTRSPAGPRQSHPIPSGYPRGSTAVRARGPALMRNGRRGKSRRRCAASPSARQPARTAQRRRAPPSTAGRSFLS